MWEKDSYWFRFGRRGLHVRKQFGMRALPPLCGVWSRQLPANAAESVDGEHSPCANPPAVYKLAHKIIIRKITGHRDSGAG